MFNMNIKTKIIILILLLFLIGTFSYLMLKTPLKKDHQLPRQLESKFEDNYPKERITNFKNQEDDQQLDSYFSVFSIFLIILVFVKHKIRFEFSKVTIETLIYLMFIKMILEIIIYENCLQYETRNTGKEYYPFLKFDVQEFLDTFLFDSQDQKNPIRQKARQDIIDYQNLFSKISLISFFYFLISYLLILLFNFIVNIFSHGFLKTCRRFKINYLWMFITNMNCQYKRIISYFLILGVIFGDLGYYYLY